MNIKPVLLIICTLMMGLLSSCGNGDGLAPSLSQAPSTSPTPTGQISFLLSSYDYGTLASGQITTVTLQVAHSGATVTNLSGAVSSPFKFKGGNYPGVGGTCAASISSDCTVVVNFEPGGAGNFNQNLTLNYNSGSASTSTGLNLIGTATLPAPTDLLFSGSNSVQMNQCVAFTVNSVVLPNISSPVTSNTTVNLAVNSGTGNFYSDVACTVSVTTRVIAAGSSSVVVYFKSAAAPQTPTLVATSSSLQSGTKFINVTSSATKLSVSAPTQVQTNDCRQISVARLDNNNLAVSSLSSDTINLVTTGGAALYSDSSCVSSATSVVIASGTGSASVYIKDATIETVNITATDQAGFLASDMKSVQVVAAVNWWSGGTGFLKRMQITIDNSDQTAAFTNQAVLIRLNSSIVGYSNFNPDGSDLRFVASDQTTELDYEVEHWDVNGNSYVWVRVPNIPASGQVNIFLYFNNPSATFQNNPASMWTNYKSIWHLSESPSDPAPQYKDSTIDAKHGTAVNSPKSAVGIIGNGLDLTGSFDSIDVGSLLGTLGGTSTFSFWIKTSQTGNNTNWLAPGITGVEQVGGTNDIFYGWIDGSGYIAVTAGNGTGAKSNLVVNDNVWRHITMTRNAANGAVRFFVNGVLNNAGTSGIGNITTDFSKFGVIPAVGGGSGKEFNGYLDEIRISNAILTDDQVKADFKFQNNSNVSFGSVEILPP